METKKGPKRFKRAKNDDEGSGTDEKKLVEGARSPFTKKKGQTSKLRAHLPPKQAHSAQQTLVRPRDEGWDEA